MDSTFPPRPDKGIRVWSGCGYQDHGPLEGPKVNIAPRTCGVITHAVRTYSTMDFLLYAVQWDNGQLSKHYFEDLFCIGKSASLANFESSIELLGATLTIGPYGGFRGAQVRLRYDGVAQDAELSKGDAPLWTVIIERMAERLGIKIEVIQLPVARRKKATC